MGNLGNDVNVDTLSKAFSKYPSFQKAKVVRERRSNKTKGFGFVSFADSQDMIKALTEMNNKYIGNRCGALARCRSVHWAGGGRGQGSIRRAVHRRRRGGYLPPWTPPPFLPFQCLRLTAKILLRRLRCQEDLSLTILGPPSVGTIGGP